jgi:outer membrane protein OmpA-like peptidoglycan-associated protein
MKKQLFQILTLLAASAVLALAGCTSAKPKADKAVAAMPAPTQMDSDGDGVPDDQDRCPGTKAGVEVDDTGCEIILRLSGPLFDFDKSNLRPDAVQALEAALPQLTKNKAKSFEIAGHTDSVGSEEYNMGLGSRRAQSVYGFLVDRGIDASRLQIKSYGESNPVADNSTKSGRAQNRRVELIDLGS